MEVRTSEHQNLNRFSENVANLYDEWRKDEPVRARMDVKHNDEKAGVDIRT